MTKPVRLNEKDLAELVMRTRIVSDAYNHFELIRDGNQRWLLDIAKRYRLKGKFTINQLTGEVVVPEVVPPSEAANG